MASINNKSSLTDEMQMLTFTLDNVLYGVNVHQVREVKNFEGVTPVPYAPDYVKGVTNLARRSNSRNRSSETFWIHLIKKTKPQTS